MSRFPSSIVNSPAGSAGPSNYLDYSATDAMFPSDLHRVTAPSMAFTDMAAMATSERFRLDRAQLGMVPPAYQHQVSSTAYLPPPVQPAALSGQGHNYLMQGLQRGPASIDLGQVAAMFSQGLGESLDGFSYVGLGNENMYNKLKKAREYQYQSTVLKDLSRMEKETYKDQLIAVQRHLGMDDKHAIARADTVAGWMSFAAPLLASYNPELLDNLAGPRGSHLALGYNTLEAARRRTDQATGRIGMDALSSRVLADNIYDEMFGDARYTQTSLRAGEAGLFMSELQKRGMLTGVRPADLPSLQKLSPQERDILMEDPSVRDEFRRFDAQKISGQLRDYDDALQAMQEIFGANGNPNAPIPALIESLNVLTGGGIQQFDGKQLTDLVRNTANLAENTGVGMPAMSMMALEGAARAQQMGLHPVFGLLAAQQAVAFQGGLSSEGGLPSGVFGLSQIAQQRGIMQRRIESGYASQMSKNLGTMLRIEKGMGGFKEGSVAAEMLRAAKEGRDTFTVDGEDYSTNVTADELADIIARDSVGGIGRTETFQMLSHDLANQEAMLDHGGDSIISVLRSQTKELLLKNEAGTIGQGRSVLQEMLGREVSIEEAAKISRSFSAAVLSGELSGDLLKDENKRNAYLAEAIKQDTSELSKEQRIRLAGQLFENTNEFLTAESGVNLRDHIVQSDPKTMAASRRQMRKARSQSVLQTAFSDLGQGSLLQRFFENVASEPDTAKLIAKTFGAEDSDEIKAIVDSEEFKDYLKDYRDAEFLVEQMGDDSTTPAQAAKIRKDLETQAGDLAERVQKIRAQFEKAAPASTRSAAQTTFADPLKRASEEDSATMLVDSDDETVGQDGARGQSAMPRKITIATLVIRDERQDSELLIEEGTA